MYTKIGETCEVSCNGNYLLKGSQKLQCTSEGEWETGFEPYCYGHHEKNEGDY